MVSLVWDTFHYREMVLNPLSDASQVVGEEQKALGTITFDSLSQLPIVQVVTQHLSSGAGQHMWQQGSPAQVVHSSKQSSCIVYLVSQPHILHFRISAYRQDKAQNNLTKPFQMTNNLHL